MTWSSIVDCKYWNCKLSTWCKNIIGFWSLASLHVNIIFLQKRNGRLTMLLYFDTNNILASILSLYTQPSFSSSYDDLRQGSHSDLVSYPLGHLGGSRSDRNVGRNDRNRNQNRDRYRNNSNNRSQGNRGGPSNQGPGILGAKPGDRSVPELPANPMQVPGLVKLYFWSVFTMYSPLLST